MKEYFNYLKNRSPLSIALRKLIYLRPIVKEFKGRALDVGCGIGEAMSMWLDSAGIDIDKNCVDYCRDRDLDVREGNIYEIPFSDGSFNTVLCSNVLEHLDEPDSAMREISRVLLLGGRLIVSVPMKRAYKRDATHRRFWSELDLKLLFRRHNFLIRKVFCIPRLLSDHLPFLNGELTIIGVKDSADGEWTDAVKGEFFQ